MPHYLSYRSVLKNRFGKPVIKIPINAGFSCPNRDGTKSTKGCFFCDNRSFSPAAEVKAEEPVEQLCKAVSRLRKNRNGALILPYLQPFSNTYGSVDDLKRIYEPLLQEPGVIGCAIGTRPDCFSDAIYRYLADLAKKAYIVVELGLQSSHDTTLSLCNRGHTFADFIEAIKTLSSIGIETVAHVMLGLPGETKEMMFSTANRLAELPCSGVKIHQLMVIEGTVFAEWYRTGRLSVFDLNEYAESLCGFLSFLRPDQHIHRIMADSTKGKGLIAPLWSEYKSASLRFIHKYMVDHHTQQGSNYISGLASG